MRLPCLGNWVCNICAACLLCWLRQVEGSEIALSSPALGLQIHMAALHLSKSYKVKLDLLW